CTRVHRLNAMERMGAAMLGAALGLLPLALSAETGPIVPASTSLWLPIAGMALATALIPQLIYSYAAPLVGPARSAATGSFELPTMFAVGWLAFGETIGLREIAAAVLVTAAVLLAPAIAPPRDASKKLEGRELELARS
ncbi:MAG: EamA family transporter, partial [Pseudomonadota bacterium]